LQLRYAEARYQSVRDFARKFGMMPDEATDLGAGKDCIWILPLFNDYRKTRIPRHYSKSLAVVLGELLMVASGLLWWKMVVSMEGEAYYARV